MEIEIELKSDDSSIDLVSLRNFLQENMEGLSLKVRSQPALPGEMGVNWQAIGGGIVEGVWEGVGTTGTSLIIKGGKEIYKLIKKWQREQKELNKLPAGYSQTAIPPGITMGDGNKKIYITEDKKGTLQVYDNFEFAINSQHTYALLIGNSDFDGNFPSIPPVRNNVVDLYNLLTDKRHIGLPRENVTIIWNKNSNEIEEAMLKMSRTQDMETLILYYSGHGHKADRESLILTARNTKKVDDDIIGGVDFNFITEKVLKRSTAKQKILILDACHSGLAAQGDFDPIRNFDVKGTYILTSSGDEASYFEKNNRHTFFTGTLLNLLNDGINDETKEMLSLEDIYKFSFEKLVAGRFPEPHFKNQLNITASAFLLARNPQFSVERLKQTPEHLLAEGRAEEAFEKYKQLVRRFPDDDELRRKKDACDDIVQFNELVHAGDSLYHEKKDYTGAIAKYKQALQINKNDLVVNKIKKCRELLEGIQPLQESEPLTVQEEQVTKPAIGTETLGAAKLLQPDPPVQSNASETYTFNDEAAIISYKDDPDKKVLEIPYAKMIEFTYLKSSHTIVVKFYNDKNLYQEQKFNHSTKEEAIHLKNFISQKTGIKKRKGKVSFKDLAGGIIIVIIACLLYLAIIEWATEYKGAEKGLVAVLAKIFDFIGSILTAPIAIGFVSITIIIAIISAISENRKGKEEVYTR